ncbi:MAG: MotA/TolQ/ExbB proton channel family protein [Gammaproteobacteria bacterium]|nr:MotA/TolQ/ExbB proton channel family protein [Gammaproteobacteria bacterium]
MNNAYRTFVIWLIWASAATTIYLGLYLDTDILEFLSHDESKITWIIIFLFLVGVFASFLLTINITGEHIEASNQEEIAAEKGLMGLKHTGKKQKTVNKFFESLKIVAMSNESPQIEVLLDMEYATLNRRSHTIEVLGNLLITLGLIGTVMGLTLTLSGLTSSLDALGTDQDLLLEGLRHAMGGMGTAFYTTLLGAVLGGVLLRIFALITDNGIGALQDYITKICMVHLTSDFKPTVERDVRFLNVELDALGEKVQTLQSAFRDSKESIHEFHMAIKELSQQTGADEGVYTLRETLRMQKYYRVLIRQELTLMNKLNRSWWSNFRDHLSRPKQDK